MLVFLTESVFYLKHNGQVCSRNGSYGDSLWKRYTDAFGNVVVVARSTRPQSEMYVDNFVIRNNKVSFLFINKLGARGVIRSLSEYRKRRDFYVIARIPGLVSYRILWYFIFRNWSYSVECVGDAYVSIKALDARFSNVLALANELVMKSIVYFASNSLYVNNSILPKKYSLRSKRAKRIWVASNVEIDAVSSSSSTWEGEGEFRLVAIGSLAQSYKRFDLLIYAVKELLRSGYDVKLKWIGEGKLMPHYEELIERLGLNDNVTIIPRIKAGQEVLRELARHHLYVQSSDTEGLSRASIEAMSVGLPLVASDVGGTKEICSPRSLFPAGNTDKLVDLIVKVILDTNFFNELRQHSLTKASDFKASRLMEIRHSFYHSIINDIS